MGVTFNIVYNSLDNTYTFTNTLYDFTILGTSSCMEILGFKDIHVTAVTIAVDGS